MTENIFNGGTTPSTSVEAPLPAAFARAKENEPHPETGAASLCQDAERPEPASKAAHAPCRQAEREAAEGAERSGSLSLSHNSNEQPDLPFRLTGSQRKTAYALEQNVRRLVEEEGLENVGFLTITVGDETPEGFRQVWDADEASRRMNSLATGLLRDLFGRCVVVTERHKSGAIHFHLIVDCKGDIRTGFDFQAFFDGKAYAHTATEHLARLWAILRERLAGYGFGRSELTPIYKSGEAVACYVAKYVEKNLFARVKADKGKKLVRYVGWKRSQMTANGFCWATPGAIEWRRNAAMIAGLHGVTRKEDVAKCWGSRWAHKFSGLMADVERGPELHPRVMIEMLTSWAEREMIDPTWWRSDEDIFREREFGVSHGELALEYVTPDEIREMMAALREVDHVADLEYAA